MSRTVEIFTGAYAGGKSETAINRALQYKSRGKSVTIVDLDTVEPAYCLRPIVKELEELGLDVIAQTDYTGLGEAASYVTAEQINCLLLRKNDIVIDVGYGAAGLDVLDILNNIENEKNLLIYLVVNTSKFETYDVESILEYIDFSSGLKKSDWKKFSGLISNTHFGSETLKEDIIKGYNITKEASEKSRIPIRAIAADEKFKPDFGDSYDNVEMWYLKRYMPQALWSPNTHRLT